MQEKWPPRPRECGNRLQKYDIAEWLRLLVEMRIVQKRSVADISYGIRKRLNRGEKPWE